MRKVIEVRNLYKLYRVGDEFVRALDGVDFEIYEGEFCAIVGTSGSGKSTLLNMLAGLEKPTKGEVIIAGKHIEKLNEEQLVTFRRDHVGFIFQSFHLMGTLNAVENVALPLSFRGVPRDVRVRKANEMLDLVKLGKHKKHLPNQMSGGQQQRVGVARALVVDPDIIFADEPTGNLDSHTSEEVMELMQRVVREQKKTLVMVTHDDHLATYADRVFHIRDGRIIKIEDNRWKKGKEKEVEQSGGLTSITVTGSDNSDGMMTESMGSGQETEKRIDDQLVEKISKMDHVKLAAPIYETSVILLKGSYMAYVQLQGMTPEGLKSLNMDLGDGTLPKTGTGHLELIFGNGVITDFYETGSGNGYYDTGKVPNINLMKDSLFMITDTENYNSDSSAAFGDSADRTAGAGSQSDSGTGQTKPVQKYVVRASGVINGGLDDYSNNYDSVFCDLETLKQLLRKEYAGKVIPGQPKTKAGKALKGFYYTSLKVKADDIDHVNEVADVIRNMGYNVETNAEYLDSMKSQFAIVQAVLGGIGAVSLLVAAIGIANTMMMSIYERTKEIGVMKVLGCSLRNIREMFLLEAAFIGLLGGIAGNILSFVMSVAINIIVGSSGAMSMGTDSTISYIPWWLVLMSMVFAVLVGVLAGYFPAKRAMKLSPLAAIRNE